MKNQRVETLRGLACILLVTYHVIGAQPSEGLHIENGPLRVLNDGFAFLRMPLFTFLSGIVYGFRPFTGNSRAFLIGKARRLLIPMIVVGTLFALVQAAVPGTNSTVEKWYLLHILPFKHFWFVESLFWIFLLIWVLDRSQLIGKSSNFFLVWLSAAVLYLFVGGPGWFAIDGAIYLLPYFLAGLAVSRFDLQPQLDRPVLRTSLIALALLSMIMIGRPEPNHDLRNIWALIAGVSLCGLCLSMQLNVAWLSKIGSYSYTIYLFHVFFTAGSRIVLQSMEVNLLPLQLFGGLLVGIVGPMIVDKIASRNRWSATLLLGKSSRHLNQPLVATSVASG